MKPGPASDATEDNVSEISPALALTRREREIMTLVCEGLSNSEIAERLFISPVTVRHHMSAIFRKLGVKSRLKLVIFAFRNGYN